MLSSLLYHAEQLWTEYLYLIHCSGQQLLTYYLHPNVESSATSALLAANVNGMSGPVSPMTAAEMITAASLSSGSVQTGSSGSSGAAAAVSAAAAQLQQHYATAVAASAGGRYHKTY